MRKNSEDKKGSEIQSKLNRKNLEQFMWKIGRQNNI
jgi:hypothetical protein